jgi:type IV secretory pathway VirB2 component (pilin)
MAQLLQEGVPGLFHDPFKDWPNSDLLIDEDDQAYFARHYPAFAPIFDWPDLRALFVGYDNTAARARKRSRRAGIFAVVAGFVSLAVAASIPLAGALTKTEPHQSKLQALLGGIAATLALISVLIGYTQVLSGKAKTRWLQNRFWTERIRQLHFQLIINNLPAVQAASQNANALQHWLAFRTTKLDEFKHNYLREADDKIHQLQLDEAECSPWIEEAWEHTAPGPANSTELDVILAIMERQRFGIQQRYADRKLRSGLRSPDTLAQWVLQLSDTFTAVLLLATISAGIGSILAYRGIMSPVAHFIAALVAAIASASIVALRALKEGLLFSADADRYRWYSAAVRTLLRRYEHASSTQKIILLRELEHVAYQEMRRFILSGSQARFVM